MSIQKKEKVSPIKAVGQRQKICPFPIFFLFRTERSRRLPVLSFSGPVLFGSLLFRPAARSRQAAHLRRPIPKPRDPENVQCRTVFIQFSKSSGSPSRWDRDGRPTRF